MPGSLLFRYSPVPGASVAFCCVTRYCSGDSREMASGSLLNSPIVFHLLSNVSAGARASLLPRALREQIRERRDFDIGSVGMHDDLEKRAGYELRFAPRALDKEVRARGDEGWA